MNAIIKSNQITFRQCQIEDLAALIAIEKEVYQFPWSIGIFTDCLRVGYYCVVLEVDEQIVSYGIMSLGAHEAHVLNLCVDPVYQQSGYGRMILEHLMETAKRLNAGLCLLEVRESNSSAIRLYHAAGFNQIGSRKNYYPATHGREDAIIYALDLGDGHQ